MLCVNSAVKIEGSVRQKNKRTTLIIVVRIENKKTFSFSKNLYTSSLKK